jgi:hypothetical protein
VEQTRINGRVRQWAEAGTRRRFLGVLAGLGIGGTLLAEERAAGKHGRKKPRTRHFCLNGKTIKATNKHKKRRLREQGAVRGRCQAGPGECTPSCPANGCGMTDGCGGICGCGADAICVNNTCHACTVTCTDRADVCGGALQDAIDAGGNVYVCPGHYARTAGFDTYTNRAVNIHGAGPGDDPASNTILDATGTAPVLIVREVTPGDTVTVSGLRLTGGKSASAAGGIHNYNAILTVENCAIVGNSSSYTAGGLYTPSALTMSNSLVAENTGGPLSPGGIYLSHSLYGTASTITNSVIDGNTGTLVGGIMVQLTKDEQSLTIDSTSQVTNNTATLPTAPTGGILKMLPAKGTVSAIGAMVTGNKPDTKPQCEGVIGC